MVHKNNSPFQTQQRSSHAFYARESMRTGSDSHAAMHARTEPRPKSEVTLRNQAKAKAEHDASPKNRRRDERAKRQRAEQQARDTAIRLSNEARLTASDPNASPEEKSAAHKAAYEALKRAPAGAEVQHRLTEHAP